MRKRRGIIKKTFLLAVLGILLGATGTVSAFFYFSSTLPSVEEISTHKVSQSTKIYDRTGLVLLYEASGGEQRTVVPLAEMPQYLKDATVAIEDERFYGEPAFDWKGILSAVFVNLTRREIVQGGSTITQQLARNAFLTFEQTVTRKIKQLILAVRLDNIY